MNSHVQRYFQQGIDSIEGGKFHHVCPIQEAGDWGDVARLAPKTPRGWFELSQLSREDRVEFVRAFWSAKLPFVPHIEKRLNRFFSDIEDIEIYLTQQSFDAPHQSEMVYVLKDDMGFFHGWPGATSDQVAHFSEEPMFAGLPPDYLAFLSVHDRFSKVSDTGTIPIALMRRSHERLQQILSEQPVLKTGRGEAVIPERLIPFYQSFGLPSFQCFFTQWQPNGVMGNVYFSGSEHSLSDVSDASSWTENLAFPTFLDWLVFYLETIKA